MESELPKQLEDNMESLNVVEEKIESVQLRQDYYQTETHVVVSVMLRKYTPKAIDVKLTANTMDVNIQLEGYSDFNLHLNLFCTIIPDRSSWKQTQSRIEIKLCKGEAIRWNGLERSTIGGGTTVSVAPAAVGVQSSPSAPVYPTSCATQRDWDKIVVEIVKQELEEEKSAQGDAAVNTLFQNIFAQGDEDVQRAMNKSFFESGGTVLSTNWKEVGEKPVEVKPPEGMEFRQWKE